MLGGLGASTERPLHRRADGLVFAVDAAYPAAGSAFTFLQLGDGPFDVGLPGGRLLDGNIPANPLIAGQRRQAVPYGPSGRCGNQRFL